MTGVHQPLPSLPHELLAWDHWRAPMHTPLTPPASAIDYPARPNYFAHKSTTVLPPIAALDRQLRAPPTPPYENPSFGSRLPPIRSDVSQDTGLSSNYADYVNPLPHAAAAAAVPLPPATQGIDWLGVPHAPSGRNLAEKMCETICYIWYAPPASGLPSPPHETSTTRDQLVPTPHFVAFMQKVLETTQVSQSVIVLALHYIYRLKQSRMISRLQVNAGSEWKVAINGLMLANKFVDDNTYTNKTWAEVSGVRLDYLNVSEKEFLEGLDYNLYVNKEQYDSWLKLLQGLVLSKDRARGLYHQRTRRTTPRVAAASRPPPTHHVSHVDTPRRSHRARSSSPSRRPRLPALYVPPMPATGDPSPTRLEPMAMSIDPAAANVGAKRSATDAFSPTSAVFDQPRPQKRPTGITLEIPQHRMLHPSPPGSKAASPLETLAGFGRLSLATSDSPMQPRSGTVPQTLVAPYRLDPNSHPILPQNLYYYALSGSPAETPSDESGAELDRYSWRKGRLRYHQPTTATAYTCAPPASAYSAYQPQVVQSANTSPRDVARILPPLPETQAPPSSSGYGYMLPLPAPVPVHAHLALPPVTAPALAFSNQQQEDQPSVPAAPFANAGPPGFHFYASTSQAGGAAYGATPDWAWQHRGRQR